MKGYHDHALLDIQRELHADLEFAGRSAGYIFHSLEWLVRLRKTLTPIWHDAKAGFHLVVELQTINLNARC